MIRPVLALAALLALAQVATAGAPLKCVDYRCRQQTEARKSGSIVIHDCEKKNDKTVCRNTAQLRGAPLKGVGR